MHELSIATGVFDSVVSVANENHVLSVNRIDLLVGRSTAVIEEALVEACNALKLLDDYKLLKNSKINIEFDDSKDVFIKQIEVEKED